MILLHLSKDGLMRVLVVIMAVLAMTSCDFIGGGDTIVRGDDNLVVRNPNRELVSRAFAQFEAVPRVSDADLQQMYAVIRRQALDGDLDATLVMLRLAAIQRQPVDEEADD
jgi:hypothetical protein